MFLDLLKGLLQEKKYIKTLIGMEHISSEFDSTFGYTFIHCDVALFDVTSFIKPVYNGVNIEKYLSDIDYRFQVDVMFDEKSFFEDVTSQLYKHFDYTIGIHFHTKCMKRLELYQSYLMEL